MSKKNKKESKREVRSKIKDVDYKSSKNKKQDVKDVKDRQRQDIKEKPKQKNEIREQGKDIRLVHVSYLILVIIFFLSLYLRLIRPWHIVTNGVAPYAIDDAIFQMRLVENTLAHFPHRIFYDPFTLYPYGAQLTWGPLFDQMIAFFSLVAATITNSWNPTMAGMPSQSAIDFVGLIFPGILGALVIIPVYFISKELFDIKTGILAALFISVLPGQFFSRSILGFTDHHVAEVLFTTLTVMFWVLSLKNSDNLTFKSLFQNKIDQKNKKAIIYACLAGLSFATYLLIWTFGVYFCVVFLIFIISQYVIDHFQGKSTEYLGIIGAIIYIIPFLALLPYIDPKNGFSPQNYSFTHLIVTGGFALIYLLFSFISTEMSKRKLGGIYYLSMLVGIVIIGITLIHAILPGFYQNTIGNFNYIFAPHISGGGATIAEGSALTQRQAYDNFGFSYYLSFIGILILIYYITKNRKPEFTLLLIWTLFVLAIMEAQNRFAYYYAANLSILVGLIGSTILYYLEWKKFDPSDSIKSIKKMNWQIIPLLAFIGFTLFVNASGHAAPVFITWEQSEFGALGEGFYEWHSALDWMRYNTPDPGLDYYGIYKPPTNTTYPYPDTAYGVMSWWDYGNIITYWAHRIPNANPFQEGIGGGDQHIPGAATYLLAPTEDKANQILDALGINGKPGSRYVVSNAYMAYAIQEVFAEWDLSDVGYLTSVESSNGPVPVPALKLFNTMESKLHIFDTNGLQHYRLVHESQPNPNTLGGADEKTFKYIFNTLYGGSVPIEESGYAKIFEYVKGANITGNSPPNSIINLNLSIKTNIDRTFSYSQNTTSDNNGKYKFIVPYSTTGPIQGETQFDTKPVSGYTLTVGNMSKQVDISEKDVLEGGSVTLNLVG